LTPIAGVARIHTSVVLREVKFTTSLPLRRLEPPKGKDAGGNKGRKGRRDRREKNGQ
jgi:hypothetical protein